MSIENIAKRSGNLPVFQIADAVNQTLSEHNSIVITKTSFMKFIKDNKIRLPCFKHWEARGK